MSLLVWFPFQNNLDNYGSLKLNPTVTSSTINSNKEPFGHALYTSSSNTFRLTQAKAIPHDHFTTALWVCSTTAASSSNRYVWGVQAAQNSAAVSLFFFNNTSSTGWGVRFKSNILSSNMSVVPNEWIHLTVTYDGTTAKIFANGELKNSSTTYTPYDDETDIMVFGRRYSSGGNFAGYIADARVYDEVLDDSEIKLLAKGLLMHYPMNENIHTLNNLVASNTRYGQHNSTYGNFNHSASSATGQYGLNTDSKYIYFKNYTRNHYWQADTITSVNGGYSCSPSQFTITPGYYSMQVILKDETEESITSDIVLPNGQAITTQPGTNYANQWSEIIPLEDNFYLCKYENFYTNRAAFSVGPQIVAEGHKIYLSFIAFENERFCSDIFNSKEQVIDNSGFNHNLQINGNPSLDALAPRYGKCTKFNGIDETLILNNTSHLDINSFSFYLKIDDPTIEQCCFICPTNNLMLYLNGSSLIISLNSSEVATYNLPDSNWHYYVIQNNTVPELYIDGVLQESTGTTTGLNITTTQLCIGGQYDTNYSACSFCDFRGYIMPLSAEEIATYYKTLMKIDKNKDIRVNSISEEAVDTVIEYNTSNSTPYKLQKTSTLRAPDFVETSSVGIQKDVGWLATEFIER